MLQNLKVYFFLVLIFGSGLGFLGSLSSNLSLTYLLVSNYVFVALMWGSLIFNAFIDNSNSTSRRKVIIRFGVALSASAIAYFYFSVFGQGEITQNVLSGWGEDRSTYREYPIKGYELFGSIIFILYIVIGFLNLSERLG